MKAALDLIGALYKRLDVALSHRDVLWDIRLHPGMSRLPVVEATIVVEGRPSRYIKYEQLVESDISGYVDLVADNVVRRMIEELDGH